MNDKTIRNILIVVTVVVVALIALGFISTLLTNIVPILIAAVVGFLLGRASVNTNLFDLARSMRVQKPAPTTVTVEKTAAKPAVKVVETPAQPEQTPAERLADGADELKEMTVKSGEEIEAEARLREQEIAKRASSPDAVQAALEERRKRLLGDKGEGG